MSGVISEPVKSPPVDPSCEDDRVNEPRWIGRWPTTDWTFITSGSIRSIRVPPSGTEGRGDLAPVIVLVIAAQVSAALVLTGMCPLVVNIVAGLFLLIALPVMLVNAKINWPESTKLHEALVYSLALVVLGIMVGGLVINEVLPLVGVARPLDRVPVVVTLLIALTALAVWRHERWRLYDGHFPARRARMYPAIGRRDQALLLAGAIMVVASVTGAFRLNNGAGGSVAIAMLILAAVVIVAVFTWRRRVNESTIMVTIYLLSLSLLLITSLRGWFLAGHDIQREFRVFDIASSQGVWRMEWFRDAYNACLSINILPTIIERATGIPEAYIYKVVYQLLFALCPVLIYLIGRRFASKPVSILGVVYFIAFPVYCNDMPFINRQEVAFFFLGTALLLITNHDLPIRARQIAFVIFGIGIILSHYSTTYVMLAVLIVGRIYTRVYPVARKLMEKPLWGLRPLSGRSRHRANAAPPAVLNSAVILTLAVLAFLWVTLTGTGGEVEETYSTTVNQLTGKDPNGQRSSDGSYSIFGHKKVSMEKRMKEYGNDTLQTREKHPEGYYPLSEVQKYTMPIVTPEQLPVTTLGKAVERLGINVSMTNRLLRSKAPIMLQLFVALGFLMVLLGRARGFLPSFEFIAGAAAFMVIVSSQVVLPFVSVEYGILRTFDQGLFWLAPFLAVGSIQAFGWLGRPTSMRVALGCATAFFVSLTGLMPQLLGGVVPQLHLNNAGLYYNCFYFHPQELSAIEWLQPRIKSEWDESGHPSTIQAEVATDKYSVSRLQNYSDIHPTDDIFPLLLRKKAYVFMGYTAVSRDEVTFVESGDPVTYKYPFDFLDNNKSLIYSSNGVRIYR
jgi:uncharacterized membrane protein